MDINIALVLIVIGMASAIPAYFGLITSAKFDFIAIPVILVLYGYALYLAFGAGVISEALKIYTT